MREENKPASQKNEKYKPALSMLGESEHEPKLIEKPEPNFALLLKRTFSENYAKKISFTNKLPSIPEDSENMTFNQGPG